MTAPAVTATPTAGAHFKVWNLNATNLPANDASNYDSTKYPSEPQLTYWFQLSLSGQPTLKSRIFAPSAGGTAEWNSVLIPAAGTWQMDIIETSDGTTSAATGTIVVS